MVFDRKSYMKKYYQQNKTKLKKYSSDYKKEKAGKTTITKVELKRGSFTISFD